MVFAGLQKSSLIDFPGRISCVVFVTGCNFTCPFCHNPELARGEVSQPVETAAALDFAETRRGFLDGVVITGGEPTLWPGLYDFCGRIQSMGLEVKVDTNGSRPGVLDRLLRDHRVDYLAMDIKTAPEDYAPPVCGSDMWPRVEQSIDLIRKSDIEYEFRTTCLRPFVDEEKIRKMAAAIAGARRYILQSFRPDTVLDPRYFNQSEPVFTPDQLKSLQAIAAPAVKNCIVR